MVEVEVDYLKRLQVLEYISDLDYCCNQHISWGKLKNKTVLITGATGMIGTFLIDVLICKNDEGLNCQIEAVGRNAQKAKERLPYFERSDFSFIEANICDKDFKVPGSPDYIIHLASTTHPVAYSTEPVETIESNIIGLSNLLDFFVEQKNTTNGRVLLTSSVEVYGENRGDIEYFNEEYCGYIDCNTLRAGYPESKRLCEAMCQAYIKQHNLDIVIARLPRTYGPTMLWSDTKAISQFIKNAITGENIVLKSDGNQLYSYLYVADSVSALLWCLLEGSCGEAYNAADKKSDISLKDLAQLIADYCDTKVIFDIPGVVENAGYSKATKALMSADKLTSLGWCAEYDMSKGLFQTFSII